VKRPSAPTRARATPARPPSKARAPDRGPSPLRHALFALGAFVALGGAAVAAIQVFGDPADGGPRRVVSLSPAPAAAGDIARVPFSEAAVGETEAWFEPDQPPAEVETAPDGTIQISVVEAERPRTSIRPQPLPRAPAQGMTEQGPLGPLPIVASDGRRAWSVYARPFSGDATLPKIAIVIGGLGFNQRATTQAIEELPPEVTLSFVPYADGLQSWIDRARAHGHEVMLELPMEPFDPDADDTGPQTLQVSATPQQNIQRLETLLSRASGYFAVTNYQGGRFATSGEAARPVMQALYDRGLAMITNGLGQRTAMATAAAQIGMPNTAADRIIDTRREAAAIDEQLLNLEALALQNGAAIGAGFAYPVTIDQVNAWAAELSARGYTLAPASAVLRTRVSGR
jgi:hypothetical protein